MHIDVIPNRQSKPAVLLRESYRVGRTVRKRTLANLSSLPMDRIELIRRVLKGEKLVGIDDVFEVVADGSPSHGHVEAVRQAMKRLDFDRLVSSRPSRERDLVRALVAARILNPQSKLATTRWWGKTTLPEVFGVTDATEDDLYEAMDWVLGRQERIEQKLAARHLEAGGLALYDLTSSYFEGTACPLARFGHNRDGKKGKLQVNYGLLTNGQGIPVSVSVFEGNTSDPKTLLSAVGRVREQFGIAWFTIVGDRGMITQVQIDVLRQIEGLDWITALRSEGIAKLLQDGAIQMGLFAERNLFELTHPDFPGERLVACRNPQLAQRRAHKRQELLEATRTELEKVRQMVLRNRLEGAEAIRARAEKILKRYQVGRYYTLDVREDGFDFEIDSGAMAADLAGVADTEAVNRRRGAIQAAHRDNRQTTGTSAGPDWDRVPPRKRAYWGAGRQGPEQIQSRQTLQARHRRHSLRVRNRPGEGRGRSRARRDLRDPHQPSLRTDERRRYGSQLQVAHSSRARVSFIQNHPPQGAAHPPLSGKPRPGAHLSVHARLLRPVAHDGGVAPVAVRRRGSGGQNTAGPRGARRAFRRGLAQNPHARARR